MHPLVSLLIVAVTGLASAPAHMGKDSPIVSAQSKSSPRSAGERPTNLSRYSLQFWPRNTLRAGQIVSTDTPYGTFTCRSTGTERPRECSLFSR
jgi:hypothetical protein